MSRGTRIEVHLASLRHNLAEIRARAPGKRVWAVVKANGYGHGLLPMGHTLAAAADGLAVATMDEAISLREGGLDCPILLLEGALSVAQSGAALKHNLELVIHTPEQLVWLHQALAQRQAKGLTGRLWLKLDTGMHRLGLQPDQLSQCLADLPACSELGFMTHFACADEPDNDMTAAQVERFYALLPPGTTGPLSLANSAGILNWPAYQGDWVRPGIVLYGASPCAGRTASYWNLQAVMRLTAPIIALRDVPAGDSVGYGATYRADRPRRIATVAIGYADGYPRHAPSGTPVAVCGQRTGTVGRVSMDMLSIDVTHIPEAALAHDVELWGSLVSVDEVARLSGTIGYELLTRLSVRGETRYLES